MSISNGIRHFETEKRMQTRSDAIRVQNGMRIQSDDRIEVEMAGRFASGEQASAVSSASRAIRTAAKLIPGTAAARCLIPGILCNT